MAHVALMRRTRQRASAFERMGGPFLFPSAGPLAMKIGSGKPVVEATLVVARSRSQPNFIPLCGIRKAMAIPTIEHYAVPDTGRESKNPTP